MFFGKFNLIYLSKDRKNIFSHVNCSFHIQFETNKERKAIFFGTGAACLQSKCCHFDAYQFEDKSVVSVRARPKLVLVLVLEVSNIISIGLFVREKYDAT